MLGKRQLEDFNLSTAQLNLLFRLRTIWRDIATQLRSYLLYVFLDADPALIQSAKQQLTELPVIYANIFRLYFGDVMADQHEQLMSNYVNLLTDLIDATKAGDEAAVQNYTQQINQNIEERLDLLTYYNPFWERGTLSNFLIEFNRRTLEQIQSFAQGDFQNNVSSFNSLLTFTDRIGDYFTEGLLRYITFSAREPRF
ncbi:hypothetical protein Ami103574_05355 [Aminipila butyrica]|uniref:Uncharacterized protein n=1 Tax=Aminipila butyrica TaxID=433296 RepID=A0A858BTV9_9FIRM|nr:hypothetical protein [Aminipila butyrica]QIB68782.1 hypothetical protein Ami103574_05355 [Aminipila butyrica]